MGTPHCSIQTATGCWVFGGRNNGGVVNDQDVYALSYTNVWSKVTLTSGSPRPPAREGHSWIVDPYLRDSPLDAVGPDNDRRFVLLGGMGADGVRRKDAWALWIHENGNATWQSLPDPPSGMSGVTRHTSHMGHDR